ncbi:hypothetical protein [Streptomyces sp. NBC_00470]|uniref:hypothetical protein n=1 Tax=Streptomyces sp. NBC_00470 TaxID=2975753 RepID=UPI002F9177E4
MHQRILTLPDSPDRFAITSRPSPTLTDRVRLLPDGMNTGHATVVRAHQVRPGDVVIAFFTEHAQNPQGTRHAIHLEEAFTANPHPDAACPCQDCDACEAQTEHDAAPDRYICLAPADTTTDCHIVYRNTPVAIIPATRAAAFPPLHTAPLLPDLFTLDEEHGPYEALPVARSWGPFDAISVTRSTAEQITTDLTTSPAGRHLTCRWLHDTLLIVSDPRQRTDPGRPGRIIEPDADGRYQIGGLWRWEEWPDDAATD